MCAQLKLIIHEICVRPEKTFCGFVLKIVKNHRKSIKNTLTWRQREGRGGATFDHFGGQGSVSFPALMYVYGKRVHTLFFTFKTDHSFVNTGCPQKKVYSSFLGKR